MLIQKIGDDDMERNLLAKNILYKKLTVLFAENFTEIITVK